MARELDLGSVMGPTGKTGVSLRLKGAWASGTAYVNDTSNIDVVTYNGSTYGCIKSNTASTTITPTNTTYWQVLAAKGDTGGVGPKGDTGNTGSTGATGSVGPQGKTGAMGATGSAGEDGKTPEFELRNGHLWAIYS